jgi:uncharacterized membrane protein YfcA
LNCQRRFAPTLFTSPESSIHFVGIRRLVGNQGGIRSAAMLGLEVQGPAFVATSTAIGLAVDAVRMPVYFATAAGHIFSAWPAIVSGVIGVVIGTLVGERILRRIPERVFRRVVSAILVAVGIVLVVVSS